MRYPLVRLTDEDELVARRVAATRHANAVDLGLVDIRQAPGHTRLSLDVVGARGEVAFARYIGYEALRQYEVPGWIRRAYTLDVRHLRPFRQDPG